jgi:hypothetical protein
MRHDASELDLSNQKVEAVIQLHTHAGVLGNLGGIELPPFLLAIAQGAFAAIARKDYCAEGVLLLSDKNLKVAHVEDLRPERLDCVGRRLDRDDAATRELDFGVTGWDAAPAFAGTARRHVPFRKIASPGSRPVVVVALT